MCFLAKIFSDEKFKYLVYSSTFIYCVKRKFENETEAELATLRPIRQFLQTDLPLLIIEKDFYIFKKHLRRNDCVLWLK